MSNRLLKIDLENKKNILDKATDILLSENILIIPTDTVYGLASVNSPYAIDKIYKLKGREAKKPIAFLASDIDVIFDIASTNEIEERIIKSFMPGALTIILNTHIGEEAFRVPKNDIARELACNMGGLIRATSANISGTNPANSAQEALSVLKEPSLFAIDDGLIPNGEPSTVVKVIDNKISILRQGALSIDDINQVL